MLDLNSITFRADYTDWQFVSTVLSVFLQTHTGMPSTHIYHSQRDQNPITKQNLRDNRGFLKRISMEAEELMEDFMQFPIGQSRST